MQQLNRSSCLPPRDRSASASASTPAGATPTPLVVSPRQATAPREALQPTRRVASSPALTPLGSEARSPQPARGADAGSLTVLYVHTMRVALHSRDAWGSWAPLGDALRGVGVLAIVVAPLGLPCAAVADAARWVGRSWRQWRDATGAPKPERDAS